MILTSLDISAAFDSILIDILEISFGINGNVLNWKSKSIILFHLKFPLSLEFLGGLSLGHSFFTMYFFPLTDVFIENNVPNHTYADDNQLYSSTSIDKFN